jgi:hypothetical protein
MSGLMRVNGFTRESAAIFINGFTAPSFLPFFTGFAVAMILCLPFLLLVFLA